MGAYTALPGLTLSHCQNALAVLNTQEYPDNPEHMQNGTPGATRAEHTSGNRQSGKSTRKLGRLPGEACTTSSQDVTAAESQEVALAWQHPDDS